MKQNNIEDIYELSPMQQGMLFHKIAAPGSVVYFEQNCLTLQTQLNISAFQKAWQRVVDRHPILRTSFYWDNLDKPYQVVHQKVDLPWEFQDWRELSFSEQQKQLKEFLKTDGDRGFELSEAPLIRITLIQVADDTYEFVFSFHHILMEGWSINWLWKECYEFYNAFCQGKDLYLESPRPYKEYIAWLHQQDLDKAEAFWRQKLKGFTLPTPIIAAKTSASDQKEDYQKQEVLLSATMTTALKSFARKHQLTLNILIKGAWALLLSRYSQNSDIVFGSTSSGRPTALADAESMVGLFINTLPLRVEVDSNTLLTPWLKKLQAEEVQMREYEYSPLIKIQQWSEIPRGLRLFDSILVFDNELVDYNQGELAESIGIVESQLLSDRSLFDWTNYPLTLGVVPNSDLLNLSISYDIRRFDSDIISRMLGHLKTLLEEFIANPERKLRELPMLTAKESEQILQEWNNTKAEYSQDKCIHELFEAQVEKTPHAIAVVFEDQQLTYQELNTKANQLAHQLRSFGVKPEVLVGLCMQRSMEMIIGLLAILKAGGAYVPIDPTYPQQRLEMLLNDAQVSVLFTQNYLQGKLPAHTAKVICLDDVHWQSGISENPVNQTTPTNLAYVIYTSGSTGIPKGVAIQHQSLVNFVQAAIAEYQIQPQDRILQFASISFDAACEEIFPCLVNGATLVLRTDEMLVSIKAFNEKCQQHGVSVLDLPTAFWHQLTSELATSALKLPESLRLVIIGGEKALPDTVKTWREQVDSRIRLINSYGPTETTVVATICDVATVEGEVPIGRAIANMQTYLLDADLQPVPIGVWGELHIGGVGVARGYLNQPELTDQKFIPNPFSKQPGSRLYKTGDRVRYRNDGQIEFSDRIDNQIKIRGFRIELGEIEALINEHPSVREATVIARKDVSSKQLVAYVVANTSDLVKEQTSAVVSQLRQHLEATLPNYMMPSAFVMLDKLPLTPNGKIDRHALPAPDTTRPELEAAYQPPQTEVEKTIASIWQEILNIGDVGIHDNFFELGGHSLLLIQVYSKLQKVFQRDFTLVDMFEYPTISHLAKYFSQESSEEISVSRHPHNLENRTASVQRRKQARKEHRAATQQKNV
ncbi:amino acid adenylation domain-containing protein [Nostoc sp. UHCC 0252]|uniref:non-ribosomal peptide synthetase n=1 Tax=Nostoc sp. UHCC 0252 TaxID=3110241 RepID=UPI002B2208D8|nr:amino acid adenylation domain-containing protein [Nostoc sp. UHCC 0252]MEA5602482.1 amino acid adenylation domain-containing protein [Nostoc sp. UHCC 0252]